MTKTETMPRLRQYLRERGWWRAAPDYWNEPKSATIPATVEVCEDGAICWIEGMPDNKEFKTEQAAIDWLEANYPK